MKRMIALLFTVVIALAITLPAFAFFGFGYTHEVPLNDSKLWAGFDFGPTGSEFNVNAYLGDLWGIKPNGPNKGTSLTFLGVEAFYIGGVDILDVKVGAYMETDPIINWPTVVLDDVGFYGDLTIHVLAGPPIMWDLFASFDLNVTGGAPALSAEIGFEVNL